MKGVSLMVGKRSWRNYGRVIEEDPNLYMHLICIEDAVGSIRVGDDMEIPFQGASIKTVVQRVTKYANFAVLLESEGASIIMPGMEFNQALNMLQKNYPEWDGVTPVCVIKVRKL